MKTRTLKTIVLGLFAAAVAATAVSSRAEDPAPAAPSAPAASDQRAPAPAKKKGTPFAGDLVAVDTTAMTLTVTNLVLTITPDTIIKSGSKVATLADAVALVGKRTTGSYKKGDDGKLVALTVHLNSKSGTKGTKKKKDANPAPAGTN